MDFLGSMLERAKALQKRLVLTEGADPQTIKAARVIIEERLANQVILLGKKSDITKNASKEGVSLEDIEIINPEYSPNLQKYAEEYFNLRKTMGVTSDQAKIDILAPLRWGAMMVHLGDADAVLGGAEDNAIDVFFAGLAIIGTAPNIKTASSCVVLQTEDTSRGANGGFIFSDCHIVPNPLQDQLADIAQSAAQSCRDFLETEPVVALLSYSTKGSKGNHKDIEKVRAALAIIKEREPNLLIDGEMQVDAALNPEITDFRAPNSPIRGKVNTLVFPDMDSGNIGYHLARTFSNVKTFGPYLQGFAKPISYIPRGSSVNKVVIACAATLARVK